MVEYSYIIVINEHRFLIREGRDFNVIVGVIHPNGKLEILSPKRLGDDEWKEVKEYADRLLK